MKKPGYMPGLDLFGLVGIRKMSMFWKTCHPSWPSWLVGLIVVAVPLELPKFLDGHMLYGMIHKDPLDTAIVPIHRKMFHLLIISRPFTVVSWG
ncbi:MAG TPA: hypothetical protein QGH16_07210, partial [Verrucomicrobiota bacterium]|nr:hypothetical protein [Verrucomicrobiota bacterium]